MLTGHPVPHVPAWLFPVASGTQHQPEIGGGKEQSYNQSMSTSAGATSTTSDPVLDPMPIPESLEARKQISHSGMQTNSERTGLTIPDLLGTIQEWPQIYDIKNVYD